MADMPEPVWHDDDREWKRRIEDTANLGRGFADFERTTLDRPVSDRARAVAIAVFYTAAEYNTGYRAPLAVQVHSWAEIFDCSPSIGCMHWLTVDLAIAAVREHFAESADGRILPAHVIRKAAVLKLVNSDGA